jgi:hypothetical protein
MTRILEECSQSSAENLTTLFVAELLEADRFLEV